MSRGEIVGSQNPYIRNAKHSLSIDHRTLAFIAEELEEFGKDVMDQVVKTYKELKGKEPAHIWVTFRELAGVKVL